MLAPMVTHHSAVSGCSPKGKQTPPSTCLAAAAEPLAALALHDVDLHG